MDKWCCDFLMSTIGCRRQLLGFDHHNRLEKGEGQVGGGENKKKTKKKKKVAMLITNEGIFRIELENETGVLFQNSFSQKAAGPVAPSFCEKYEDRFGGQRTIW